MAAMQDRNKAYMLKGDVQIDDAYLGGERKGTPGRGAAGKTPFLAAVETCDGKPFYIKLRQVAAFSKEAVKSYAKEALEPGSTVISDGLSCFESLAEAGMTHTAIKRGRASRRSVDPRFKWVNTCLANLKGAITGTCRAIRRQYAGRYLAAYEYRFNRCFDLPKNDPGAGENRGGNRAETLCNPAHSRNIRVIKFRDDGACARTRLGDCHRNLPSGMSRFRTPDASGPNSRAQFREKLGQTVRAG